MRQTTVFAKSLLRLTGLDWNVPDFSIICRRQRTLAVNIPYYGAKGPLHLAIPRGGINKLLKNTELGIEAHQGVVDDAADQTQRMSRRDPLFKIDIAEQRTARLVRPPRRHPRSPSLRK